MVSFADVGSSFLLFALVFGMSATVNIDNLREQVKNKKAILTGIFLQFVILPFLGFATVKALGMSSPMGLTLLVVTSSPGGSYSNWWCSMFNADLALSVTMTAISTLMSVIMLPLNLLIYARHSYSSDVVKQIDWTSLFIALVVVICAIGLGLYSSAKIHSLKFNMYANKLGNFAGISLVLFSVLVSSSEEDTQLWDHDWKFYLGVATPCVLGLLIANVISTWIELKKPERVTVSVECCYQNVGIATSVAITMFDGKELAEAIAVPLYYGLVEALVLGFYCIVAWKVGWTKAPKDENFCVIITNSYEVVKLIVDINAIEVVLGKPKDAGAGFDETSSSYLGLEAKCSIYGVCYPTSDGCDLEIELTAVNPDIIVHGGSIDIENHPTFTEGFFMSTPNQKHSLRSITLQTNSLGLISPEPGLTNISGISSPVNDLHVEELNSRSEELTPRTTSIPAGELQSPESSNYTSNDSPFSSTPILPYFNLHSQKIDDRPTKTQSHDAASIPITNMASSPLTALPMDEQNYSDTTLTNPHLPVISNITSTLSPIINMATSTIPTKFLSMEEHGHSNTMGTSPHSPKISHLTVLPTTNASSSPILVKIPVTICKSISSIEAIPSDICSTHPPENSSWSDFYHCRKRSEPTPGPPLNV